MDYAHSNDVAMRDAHQTAQPLEALRGENRDSFDLDLLLADAPDDCFGYCRGMFLPTAPDGCGVIACKALEQGQHFDDLIERYTTHHAGADRRAVISMWTMYYFSILTIAAAVHRLAHGRCLPLALGQVSLIYNEQNGEPKAFLLPDSGLTTDNAHANEDLYALIRHHIAPLIGTIAEHGVAPKLLWNNVAAYLSWIIDEIDVRIGARACAGSVSILTEPLWPDGSKNAMYGMIRAIPTQSGETCSQRKVCCLRYKLPGIAGCGQSCPLPQGRQ